jgi:2-(1,2-epoxy-1,2-dihydrophenyl)acetyl-CoA isomerase
MKVEKTSYARPEFFLFRRHGEVAVLEFGKNFLPELIASTIENSLLKVFDEVAANDEIRALVIMNCAGHIGYKEYVEFCRQVMATETDRRSLQRMCNVFDRLVVKIVGLSKPVIHADFGEVISLFLSIGLACDYRIIATHTIFRKPYFELQTLPKGGSAFFLCKMLGYGQAKKFLLSEKDFNALEALEMGIVDQVVPYKQLEETAIQVAGNLSGLSMQSLVGIKRLINYSVKDVKDYLDFESIELLRTIGT